MSDRPAGGMPGGDRGADGNPRRIRLLVAYANDSTFVSTTREYLESFIRHSSCEVRYLHVTAGAEIDFPLDDFDIVFQSYCARLPIPNYLSASFRERLKAFRGVKMIAVQDEYENTGLLHSGLADIGYHVVFTCVPPDQVARVYPPNLFPGTEFITVLTGYVPETQLAGLPKPLPLTARPIVIGYRGRNIGGHYGRLAFDKYEIGRRMREICVARGISHDIEWTEETRIYGDAWYRFIGSCRAVLGSESGSNVFDFDGSIAARYREMATARGAPVGYDEFCRYTDPVEAEFDIGQISPRVFEAAAMRTPMILYTGRYSGIIEPEAHYIELKKDFSNVDDVLARLDDLDGLERMAERAYDFLVGSGQFGYSRFVELIETTAARKAAALGIALERDRATSLAAEPGPDRMNLASFRETPMRQPRHVVHYYYKHSHKEAVTLRAEIKRLSTEIARLNEHYPAHIEQLHRHYAAEIAGLRGVEPDQVRRVQLSKSGLATRWYELSGLRSRLHRHGQQWTQRAKRLLYGPDRTVLLAAALRVRLDRASRWWKHAPPR